MKRKLALFLSAALSLSLLLAGCGDTTGDATPTPGADPDTTQSGGGTAEVRTDLESQLFADVTTLDPQMCTSSYDGSVILQIYDSLFEFEDGDYNNLQPALCESYEVNEDATEYIFHIRQSVTFHNGDVLDAEDVAFTIERLRTSPVTSTTYSGLSGVSVVDEYTVKVSCSYSIFRLPSMLAGYTSGIVNKDLVEQYGDSAQETIVGTGAYQLEDWTPGYGIVLKAYNEGWRGAPAIQTLNYTLILDTNAARIAFQNGELDSFYATSATDLELLADNPDYQVTPYQIATSDHLVFNTTRPWVSEQKFRQAVAYAIDREALCDICSDSLWTVCQSLMTPGSLGYDEDWVFPYEYNPDKARELLAEINYDGSEVGLLYTSSYPVPNTWGTTVEAYLRAVGINVRMDGYDYSNVVSRVSNRDYDMALFEYALSYADPLSSYYALYRSDGFYNVWQTSSDEMDAYILTMYGMNDEELAVAMRDIDNWAQEQCLYIPCYQQGGYMFHPSHLHTDSNPEPMFGHIRVCYSKWLTDEELAEMQAEEAANGTAEQ